MEQIQKEVLIGFYKWQIIVKTFHFTTRHVVRHEAAGKYLDSFIEDYDKFMEVCMGHHGQISIDSEFIIKIDKINDKNILHHITEFGKFLTSLRTVYVDSPDLLNIRDEMEASLNRLVYLLKLK
jgi:hypothetical protein